MKICLETERLVIRNTTTLDADFCIDIWLDEKMGKYLSDPPREQAGDIYNEWKSTVETYDGCCYLVAVSRVDHQLLATCSLVPSEDLKTWDIGYCVHERYQRQGYGSEMIQALIKHCQSEGAHKINASVAKDNIASNMLLKKNGFIITKVGQFRKAKTDIVYDEYIYTYTV